MKFEKIILFSAFFGIASVGLGYLISPTFMYGLYDIEISSINQLNMLRSAYGGLFLGFASLFLVGALYAQFTRYAHITLFTFMSGFALGRFASILIDGMPAPLILGLLAFEVFYVAASAYVILNKAEFDNQAQLVS